MLFISKLIFGVEKYPLILIVSKHIKVPKIAFFSLHQIFSNKKGLIVHNNADLWTSMDKSAQKLLFILKCPLYITPKKLVSNQFIYFSFLHDIIQTNVFFI